jgi:phosphatidylglycerol:prolipoprotein diacylglycerol transferase
MMAYGGFAGGVGVAMLYLVRHRLDVWRYLDCGIPAVGLGYFLARLGCFLDGDDFGRPAVYAWSVQFPQGSPAFAAQMHAGLLSPGAGASLPVHPVQLYLGASALLIAGAVAWWRRREVTAPGEPFCLYWILYGAVRFGWEFLRGDLDRGFIGPLSTPQAVSTAAVLVAAIMMVHRRRSVPA